jgi:hypothetical protein
MKFWRRVEDIAVHAAWTLVFAVVGLALLVLCARLGLSLARLAGLAW